LNHKEVRGLLSDEHFSVDGTQVAAWASMKSFRAKDGSDEPPSGTIVMAASRSIVPVARPSSASSGSREHDRILNGGAQKQFLYGRRDIITFARHADELNKRA
jgi:hypothetical protein